MAGSARGDQGKKPALPGGRHTMSSSPPVAALGIIGHVVSRLLYIVGKGETLCYPDTVRQIVESDLLWYPYKIIPKSLSKVGISRLDKFAI